MLSTPPTPTVPQQPDLGNALISKVCLVHCSMNLNPVTVTSKRTDVQNYLINDEVTKAKIMWRVNGSLHHSSLRDIELNISIIETTLSDSYITEKLQLSRTKFLHDRS